MGHKTGGDMSDSNEVVLARYGERLQFIQESISQGRQDKKELSDRMSQMIILLDSIDNRLRQVEEKVSEQSPIFDEIVQLKYEITGAKKVTRWVWLVISAMTAGIVSLKTELLEIFTK